MSTEDVHSTHMECNLTPNGVASTINQASYTSHKSNGRTARVTSTAKKSKLALGPKSTQTAVLKTLEDILAPSTTSTMGTTATNSIAAVTPVNYSSTSNLNAELTLADRNIPVCSQLEVSPKIFAEVLLDSSVSPQTHDKFFEVQDYDALVNDSVTVSKDHTVVEGVEIHARKQKRPRKCDDAGTLISASEANNSNNSVNDAVVASLSPVSPTLASVPVYKKYYDLRDRRYIIPEYYLSGAASNYHAMLMHLLLCRTTLERRHEAILVFR
ncbi:hypothetical protein FA15DRAFT_660599 [Coprinopsis marcescibilis]|uniref:Uncharacterized protein n=1 Tax=Coprinopsis marcescibilis TaxID=230819 RepID=A0A5C3KEL3_COPMA|nr:hypothetical protein FA15DRAFT_660599 [Coprinopsis marcescibilis]